MIQDIFPSVLYNQYDCKAVPESDDSIIYFGQQGILIKQSEDGIIFPSFSELDEKNAVYLFKVDDKRYFLGGENENIPSGFDFVSIKDIREQAMGTREQVFTVYTAKHLYDWYRDNSFCGRCGLKMTHSFTERAMKCDKCGYTSYPRIMPAVIVGVINGEKILLTKYRRGFAHYALVAGFTEIGETLEETVAREVMEETGIAVKNIRYYKSQPWGSANDILMGFYCYADGDTTIRMDDNELKFAEWVERDKIILQPDDFSLTNEMMMKFKEGIEK